MEKPKSRIHAVGIGCSVFDYNRAALAKNPRGVPWILGCALSLAAILAISSCGDFINDYGAAIRAQPAASASDSHATPSGSPTPAAPPAIPAGHSFIAVDENGDAWKAEGSLATWVKIELPGSGRLRSAAVGDGYIVAVGDGGRILWWNGAQWFDMSPTTTADFYEAVYGGNGYFVAVGDNGAIWRSDNCVNWEKTSAAFSANDEISGIIYANGKYFITGSRSSPLPKTWLNCMSADASEGSWSNNGFASEDRGAKAAYGNGCYLVVGGDVADSNGSIYRSTTGASGTWTKVYSGAVNTAFRDIVFGNGRFVAVSKNGLVLWSDNGISWNEAAAGGAELIGVEYGSSCFVAVGASGRVIWSFDGTAGTWASIDIGSTVILHGIVYSP
jgi:hypothetical protein